MSTHHPHARTAPLALALLLAALALLAFFGVTRTAAQGPAPIHFTGCAAPTDLNHVILIPAYAPQMHTAFYFQPVPGDEFAVFRPVAGTCATREPSLCAAAMVWEGADTALVVWGDSSATPAIDGMLANEKMCWKVWDASEDKVYTATVVYDPGFPVSTGLFTAGGISGLATLSPTALKLASFEAASDPAWITRSAILAGAALLLGAAVFLLRRRKSA